MDQPKEEPHTEPAQAGASKFNPATYGNAAGSTIQSTLGKVGAPVGAGLATVTAPVGNVVDSVVGGIMRSGNVVEEGNKMMQKEEKEDQGLKEATRSMGGKEQTGGNPLGL